MVDAVVQGVLLGGLYALLAAGLALMFGVMRVVNLAHGDLIVLAAYVALALVDLTGLNPLVLIVPVAAVMAGVGYALQRGIINPTLGGGLIPPLIVTFGVSIILQNALLELFSADTQRLSAGAIDTASLALPGGTTIGWLPLLTFVLAVVVLVGLQWFIARTMPGRAFQALADDRETASLMGIDVSHTFAVAAALAIAVVGIGGVVLGIRTQFDPSLGPARLIFAFEAVIIGGLGSLWGTLAGGIVLGVAQTVGSYLNPGWTQLAGHLVFLAVLAFRPQGLFGREAA